MNFSQLLNTTFGLGIGDRIVEGYYEANPKYQNLKKGLNSCAIGVNLIAVVSGVATVLFGLITLASLSLGMLGLTAITACVCYDSVAVGGNIGKIAKMPSKYFLISGDGLDTDALKRDLSIGVFACGLGLRLLVNLIDSSFRKL